MNSKLVVFFNCCVHRFIIGFHSKSICKDTNFFRIKAPLVDNFSDNFFEPADWLRVRKLDSTPDAVTALLVSFPCPVGAFYVPLQSKIF